MFSLFKNKKSIQQEWKSKTIAYANEVNTFIAKGLNDGWENAGEDPKDNGREKLVPHLLKAIKVANLNGELNQLRSDWPLAHSPLIPMLEKNGQSIPEVCIVDESLIVARIGTHYEDGYLVEIKNNTVNKVKDYSFFGKCPNKNYFAYDTPSGIKITKGWLGEHTCICPYPTGIEGIPDKYSVSKFENSPTPSKLIVFPDGKRVLFISTEGIFVLSEKESIRLLPTTEEIEEHFTWSQEEHPEDDLYLDLAMEHGDISPCGEFIAVGSQDSTHLIFDKNCKLIGDIGNHSEYPHYAIFSGNSDQVAFNSCHFYNGITIGFKTNLLPDFKSKPYEEDLNITILEDFSRVYAGVHRAEEYIIGEASGYLKAFGVDGKLHWQHFIGSSIGDIDISKDEKTLVCTSYAGFISVIQLDDDNSKEYEIANGGHTESRRWLFWKTEKQPLAW